MDESLSDQEPFPEMLALANIIDRISAYSTKSEQPIRISLDIEMHPRGPKVDEMYQVAAFSLKEKVLPPEVSNKINIDCANIIREEWHNAFPNSSYDVKAVAHPIREAVDIPAPIKQTKSIGSSFMRFDKRE